MDWKTLVANPAADLFPRMLGSEVESLAQNIKKSGQLFPIILWKPDQSILDGRNRLAAFKLPILDDVKPRIETYNGELKPLDYVRAVNLERMHLNLSERTRLAVLLLADAKREAKERQLSGKPVAAGEVKGPSADIVAEKMGVSGTQVERAERIRREDPEAFERLGRGLTVRAAYAKLPRKSKTEIRHENEARLVEALDKTNTALKDCESAIKKLQLDLIDIPPISDERRRVYLDAAMELQSRLQTDLNKLILKLQG